MPIRHHNTQPASIAKKISTATVLCLLVLQNLLFALPTRAAAPPLPISTDIVISQVYGGGGNSGATLKNDFIELFNRGASPVTVTGWSVQYTSAGATGTTWQVTPLSGTIPAGGYYLVQEAAGAGGTVNLPTPDASGSIAMGASAGKTALVTSTTPLTCGGSNNCTSSDIKDFVGYGSTAVTFEGSGPTGTLSNTTAALRNGSGCTDTDNNSSDFTTSAPTPRNSSSPVNACSGSPTPTPTPTATPTPTPTPTPSGPADHLVISQIYGGGGNGTVAAPASFQNDYVELFNPTLNTINVTGWSIQYGSAASTGNWSGKQALVGTIGPNQYYIVSLGGGSLGAPIPRSNISNTTINISATSGKIAVVNNGDTISGACPASGPSLIDFVGYGSPNCSEGNSAAPSPSNTTAIFRKSDGAQDTDVNSADFVTGTPNPRSTAPIPEFGPAVLSVDPVNNNLIAPKDASPKVTFTEPVTVDAGWFDITCPSGQHNDVTMASTGGGRTWEVTPNVNFVPGEQCTVTIKKDKVHDVDTDDSAPDTDTMTADFVWSFTVATGAAAPFQQSIHLVMGNPSNAVSDVSQSDNFLMQRDGNALSYNRSKGTPNWVSWHLDPAWFGSLVRVDTFRPDPMVPPDWYRVTDFDYSLSGFDRGHMTPNADRDNENRIPINQETYLMSNMVPQAPDNNQGPWADMENALRALTSPTSPTNPDGDHELFIVSGPLGQGGTGSNGFANTIANGNVVVPAFTWKVVLVLPKGVIDPGQVTVADRTFAVKMPNVQGIRNNDWHIYLTTVRDIETETGYNFFSNVPEAIQNSIENGIDGNNPPGTAGQTVQATEDTPAPFTLNAVNPLNTPLTATTSLPAHGSVNCTGIVCTYTPVANYNGTDSFTFSVSNGDKTSNTSTVTLNIASVNDNPTVTNDQASPTSVQYSDAVQPVTFTASDVETAAGALTPSTTFTKGTGPAQAGLPDGLSLTQTATPGVWTLAGNIQEPAGSYTVNVTFADADGGTGSASAAFTVNKEDASVAISAPTAVLISSNGGTSGTFTVNARLADAADGASGNIANAVPVTFQLTSTGSALPTYTCTATAITFPLGVPTASCDFSNVAVDVYDVTAVIGGSYYQGSNKTVLAVYDPSLGFVSGSGTISRTVNGQTFTAEYSVVFKYKQGGTAYGSFVYIEHRAAGDITFASTSIESMAVVGTKAKLMGTGTVNSLGSYSFVASLNDNGEPGTNDALGLRITDSSGNVVADLSFEPVTLSSGNIQVH